MKDPAAANRGFFRSVSLRNARMERPTSVDLVNGQQGSVTLSTGSDLENLALDFGLPLVPQDRWVSIAQNTRARIAERLDFDRTGAIRFGAFSYLVELCNLALDGETEMADFAVRVAEQFLQENLAPQQISPNSEELRHFASVIQRNRFDWQSMLVAYLDPEAARVDRLRQNLKLTPLERVARHRKIVPQLKKARRVER